MIGKNYLLCLLTIVVFEATAQKFIDVSSGLPSFATSLASMDVRSADVDNDGDLDIILANEFQPNMLLINDGQGHFSQGKPNFVNFNHDSEDIAIADFNMDGILDVIFCSEDDVTIGRSQVHEYYFGLGGGVFKDSGLDLPDTEANAVVEAWINDDAFPDLILGNNGKNLILINDGAGNLIDQSDSYWDSQSRTTQDLQIADVNGDGHMDIFEGNEDGNLLWLNDGSGKFENVTTTHLPPHVQMETRKAAFGDLDNDGDLDVFLANVSFRPGKVPQNAIWLNDGTGKFTTPKLGYLPLDNDDSLDGLIADINGDGWKDIIVANVNLGRAARQKIQINQGGGGFTESADAFLPGTYAGNMLGVIYVDLNGDGKEDLYWCDRGAADVYLIASLTSSTGDPAEDTIDVIVGKNLYPLSGNQIVRVELLDITGRLIEVKEKDDNYEFGAVSGRGTYVLRGFDINGQLVVSRTFVVVD